ncbi:MAG: hypothetical protein ACD_83C00291G0001 [uncultured bacterium]|uniref:DUF2283 domain-containing protein n=1 Tax=Berkelbacteria bacterium GW2011_GWA2_38_9 TaxID=1618334 RepID=A0A0G0LE61_9BACT|nr:MAG: hypothetical protein ACD_83C00291G0001 [uncultured bacterium]KKQ89342.1 MAG: hypothetical protein UT11_C0028G0002 [Berkelbacteria bacterium GW2011_GWA2_38_9]
MAKVKSKQFKFSYDQEGDVLDISLDKAKSAISKEVSEDVFVRLDETTQEVLGFMILNFQKRSNNLKSRSIPISAHFELSKAF